MPVVLDKQDVVTSLIVPMVISAPLLAGLGFKKLNNYKGFSIYSIVTSIVIFVSGGASVIFAVNQMPFFGIIERITIGSSQLWTLIFALMLFTADFGHTAAKHTLVA